MNSEHALPPGRWVNDRGVKRFVPNVALQMPTVAARKLQPCGTTGAYRRHLKHGETPCDPCKEAATEDARQRRARQRKAAAQRAWAEPVDNEAAATVAHLVVAVAVATGTDAHHIYGRRVDQPTADARHMVAYLARLEGLTWASIGKALHRDHTTAIHGARRVEGNDELRTLALIARHEITERQAA